MPLKENLREDTVLVQMDFSEIFSCQVAEEIQLAYCNPGAVSLHPVVTYFRKAEDLKHRNVIFVSVSQYRGRLYHFKGA